MPRLSMTLLQPRHLLATGLLGTALLATLHAQTATAPPAAAPAAAANGSGRFPLTVDSIMRGPALVGYPPIGPPLVRRRHAPVLRVAGARRGRKRHVGGRRGRLGPAPAVRRRPAAGASGHRASGIAPAGGSWARLAATSPCIDTVAGTRTELTRTSGGESAPRWARDETHVTFVREGGLFLLPLTGGGIQQIAESGPKTPDPKKTDSQAALTAEETALLAHARETKRKRERDEARREKEALPKLELRARQTATDLQLDASGKYVWAIVTERPESAKTADVPDYVTESGYVGDLPGGPRSATSRTRRCWRCSTCSRARRPGSRCPRPAAPRRSRASFAGACRCCPTTAPSRWPRSGRPTTRIAGWCGSTRPPARPPCSITCMTTPGCARASARVLRATGGCPRRIASGSRRSAPAGCTSMSSTPMRAARRVRSPRASGKSPTSPLRTDRRTFYLTTTEVNPGERHLYAVGVDGGARTRLTTMTGSNEGEMSPDGKTIGLIYSAGNRPPEVFVSAYGSDRIGNPRDDEPHRGVGVVSLARSAGDHLSVARRQDAPCAPLHAGDGRREAARRRARRCCSCTAPAICRTRTSTGRRTTASTCSITCWRRAATSCSTWTTAPVPATGATGAPRSIATWAARTSRTSSMARSTWRTRRRSIRSGSACTAAATAASSR